MDRLQLDKNAKLTGRVYFKDEVMWLGLSGSGASFTFDGTKLVLKLKGDNIAVGDNPIDYARIAVYVDGTRVVDEMINCAEKGHGNRPHGKRSVSCGDNKAFRISNVSSWH